MTRWFACVNWSASSHRSIKLNNKNVAWKGLLWHGGWQTWWPLGFRGPPGHSHSSHHLERRVLCHWPWGKQLLLEPEYIYTILYIYNVISCDFYIVYIFLCQENKPGFMLWASEWLATPSRYSPENPTSSFPTQKLLRPWLFCRSLLFWWAVHPFLPYTLLFPLVPTDKGPKVSACKYQPYFSIIL